MKVNYSYLFSNSYTRENERIAFEAEVNNNEADKKLGELFFRVINIHKTLEKYRQLIPNIENTRRNVHTTIASINTYRMSISKAEAEIKRLKSATDDELLPRIQCDRQTISDYRKYLADHEQQLKEQDKELSAMEAEQEQLRERIKQGKFELAKE